MVSGLQSLCHAAQVLPVSTAPCEDRLPMPTTSNASSKTARFSRIGQVQDYRVNFCRSKCVMVSA